MKIADKSEALEAVYKRILNKLEHIKLDDSIRQQCKDASSKRSLEDKPFPAADIHSDPH